MIYISILIKNTSTSSMPASRVPGANVILHRFVVFDDACDALSTLFAQEYAISTSNVQPVELRNYRNGEALLRVEKISDPTVPRLHK